MGGGWSTPRPCYPQESDLGWAPGPVWRFGENLAPPRFDPHEVINKFTLLFDCGSYVYVHILLICDNSVTTQQCHNTAVSQHSSVTTQQCHNTKVSQHNSVTTQQCHNTAVSQLKMCDFSGETFKGFEVL